MIRHKTRQEYGLWLSSITLTKYKYGGVVTKVYANLLQNYPVESEFYIGNSLREELAAALSTSPSTVANAISTLKKEGVLESKRKGFYIILKEPLYKAEQLIIINSRGGN